LAVFADIDTHKDALAVAVIDATGCCWPAASFPTAKTVSGSSFGRSAHFGWCGWASSAGGYLGTAVAVHVVLCWQPPQSVAVVEVPALMTSVSVVVSSAGKPTR
jgi:transposase